MKPRDESREWACARCGRKRERALKGRELAEQIMAAPITVDSIVDRREIVLEEPWTETGAVRP